MDYLIGDIQGCAGAFSKLLDALAFSPSRDHLHVLGDLVNRGPQSLRVLSQLYAFGPSASFVLGNHDLSLLAVAAGVRRPGKRDTLNEILHSPQREVWLDWLVHQGQMAAMVQGWLTVHAGVVPAWSVEDTLRHAREIERLLRGPERGEFLAHMYGDEPARFTEDLQGPARWRAITNVLTRIRFCTADGTLEMDTKEGADAAPPGFAPWFSHSQRATRHQPMAFGHWSTLGLVNEPTLLALDTGCVWGGQLTAARVDGGRREIIQVECPEGQAPC